MEPTHFESLYPAATRQTEISKILSFIKEGSSCQVISLPGGGRSNLLGLLSYNRNVRLKHLGENQKWFHFVLCNFAEIRKRPLIEVIKFLFLSLIDSIHARHSGTLTPSLSLKEREKKEFPLPLGEGEGEGGKTVNSDYIKTLKEIFSESIVSNDELILFQGLKRTIDFLAIEKELTVVFLFDRFEDYVSTAQPEFFTNLRVLRDKAKYRFSVVFSTYKPLEDIIGQDLLSDFYQFVAGHTVYLPLLDKPGLDFRISYMEKVSGKKLNKDTTNAIIKVTAGHPNLTRLSVEAMLETNNAIPAKAGIWIPDQVGNDKSLSNFFLSQKPIKAALFDIWKSLTPAEQRLLTETFLIRHSGKPRLAGRIQNLSGQEVAAARDSGQARMTGEESYLYLQNVGLIKNNKVTIPLFNQFVKQLGKQSTHVAFDSNTLSDSLTSSEFKLLTYLMQNSGKIIEREEVINAVWLDTKSTAGVTDQALDQLIFRLRKKIEDDPNNPVHLQTVKGRGFRFVQ